MLYGQTGESILKKVSGYLYSWERWEKEFISLYQTQKFRITNNPNKTEKNPTKKQRVWKMKMRYNIKRA